MKFPDHYFPELTARQREQFGALENLYREWNEKINVISRKDMDEFYIHHVLHSLAIAKFITFKSGSKILDVGTGGGFPGIPLAIFFPEVKFHLVDSIGKKIKVVNEISTTLGLKNVLGEQCRMEELEGEYDYIVSRAVAPVGQLLKWTDHLIEKGEGHGWILLKGGDLADEIKEGGKPAKITDISSYFSEDFFLTKRIVYIRA